MLTRICYLNNVNTNIFRICYLNNVNTNIFSRSHAINPSPRTMSLISRGENFEASKYYKDVHPLYTTHGQKALNLLDMLVCVWVWDWFYLKIATIWNDHLHHSQHDHKQDHHHLRERGDPGWRWTEAKVLTKVGGTGDPLGVLPPANIFV